MPTTPLIKIFLLTLCFVGFGFANSVVDSLDENSEISTFKERISLRFLCNYNFVSFWNTAYSKNQLNSNRPVDVGVGVGYDSLFTLFGKSWDFSFDFMYSLPFTASDEKSRSHAFETGINFFPDSWWLEGRIRNYSGFVTMVNGEKEFVDLSMSDVYFSTLWMATAKGKFSARSAYFLDRRQKHSAGSLIIGGRIQENISRYGDIRRELKSGWLDMGYTYSWVLRNGFFHNLWGILGVACGKESEESDLALLPESSAKYVWGYFGDKWAWNNVLKATYSPSFYSRKFEQKFVAAYEILVVRRF